MYNIEYSENILPSIFKYGDRKMIAFDFKEKFDEEDGSPAGYEYKSVEMHYEATDEEIKAVLKDAGLKQKEIDKIFEDRQDV